MSLRARADGGQASIEWVAVVLVVAAVLALAVAYGHGQDHYVGRTITRQWYRALCIVRAGDCWRDKEPCVVRSVDQHKGVTVKVVIVKLGGGYRAIVEQRSDGTVAVTRALDGHAGVEVAGGPSAKLKLGGDAEADVGVTARAALEGQLGGSATWIVASMTKADDLVDHLKHLDIPKPDILAFDGGLHGEAGVSAVAEAAGTSVEAAQAGVSGDVHGGVRFDRINHHKTVWVQASAGVDASLGGGVLGWSRTATTDVYALEIDERGRPLDLQITSTGGYAGPSDLPSIAAPAAGMLAGRRDDPSRVVQITTHLDLTERDNAALAQAAMGSVLRGGLGGSTVQALRRRIDEEGSVEARVLSSRSSSGGVAGEVAVPGVKLGLEASKDSTSMQLEAAASRGLDGQWLPREDCVPASA